MSSAAGKIVIMGSGELTATMVEVHKSLLAGCGRQPQATFLDTPAGFQLNVDQISQKAIDYFRRRIQQPLTVASFKSHKKASDFEAEQAFHILRQSDYVLIGPGSPTYALRQWIGSPVPEILVQRIKSGGCLVAASAAALTVGRLTIPVYEIYKVGQDVHWVTGMDILGQFGFNLVIVPHWNNAEGGTHDTRFCFMGAPRFRDLQALLPDDLAVFGLDEHTACILDLSSNQAEIRGLGRAVLRRSGGQLVFKTGDRFSLDILRDANVSGGWRPVATDGGSPEDIPGSEDNAFWVRVNILEERFRHGLDHQNPNQSTNALLELDRTIWQAHQELETEEFITQARDTLRELMVLLGNRLAGTPADQPAYFVKLVEALLDLRQHFRNKAQWQDADAIRDCLQRADVVIEDTRNGSRWQLKT